MPGQMPRPYEGDCPYMFINYARADKDVVLPIVRALDAEGFRVWWDDGIEPTTDYDEYLADHVYGCDCLVMFVSSSSLKSDWCTHEVRYALDLKKKVLPIYLEDVELTRGLQMRMGGKQALFWYEYDSDEAFCKKLFKARRLDPCLTEKGKRSRGVKPRSVGAEADGSEMGQPLPAQPEAKIVPEPETTSGVKPKVASKAEPATAPATERMAEPKSNPSAGPKSGFKHDYVDELKAAPRAESKTALRAAPTNGPSVELKAEATSAPRVVSTAKAVQGASVGQRDNTSPSRVARQGDGRASSGGRGAKSVRVADDKPGGVAGVTKRDRLADYSWAELKLLSQAILAAGSDAEGLTIAREYGLVDKDGRLQGDEKPLQLKDGTKTSVRILGFRHDELAGGGKAGISFEFADMPTTHRMNPSDTNQGGWERSEMRGWLNSSFFRQLPDELLTRIEATRKRTNNRGEVERNDKKSVTATIDRLWLLSMSEVYGRQSLQGKNVPWSPATYDAEGAQYQLYVDKGVSTSNYDSCAKEGASSWWWLRSPDAGDSGGFHGVYDVGDWGALYAYGDWGVSPGFCF